MKDKLIAKGWVMFYECKNPCARQHFSHVDFKGYEIRVRTKSNTFSIMLNNMVSAGPFWGYQLDDKLKANGLSKA